MGRSRKQATTAYRNKQVNARRKQNEQPQDAKPAPKQPEGSVSGDLREKFPFRSQTTKVSLSDYKWSHQSINYPGGNNNNFDNVPRIIIEEFQPDISINTAKAVSELVLAAGAAGGKALASKLGKSKTGKKAEIEGSSGTLGNLAGPTLKQVATEGGFAVIQNSFTSESFKNPDEIQKQVEVYSNLFSGQFLRNYELPYHSEQDYLNYGSHGSWTADGIFKDGQLKAQTMGFNIPSVPEWKIADTKPKITTNFHLINDTTDNLAKNFKFLQVLSSGAMWMQIGWFQKSPNVYRVTVPGRRMFFFASMEIKCKYVGKLRRNLELSGQLQGTVLNAGDYLFPEAYEVEVSFESLTPENFNTTMYFHSKAFSYAPQGVTQAAYTTNAKNLAEPLKQVGNAVTQSPGAVLDQTNDILG